MIPTLLIINGISSAGKSSLAHSFQTQSAHQWMRLSLDDFFDMFPTGANYTKVPYERFLEAFYKSVAIWAAEGFDLIVDTVFESERCLKLAQESLQSYRVYLIALHCPLEEAERREQRRGNRPVGLARKQFQHVHSYCDYDLELNSFDSPSGENVNKLNVYLSNEQQPSAFQASLNQTDPKSSLLRA